MYNKNIIEYYRAVSRLYFKQGRKDRQEPFAE